MRRLDTPEGLRIGRSAWAGAVLLHVLLLVGAQFANAPVQSSIPKVSAIEAVRVQAMDARELEQRREAYQRALREAEERRRQAAAAKAEAERQAAERERQRKEEKRRAAEKRKAEEAERKKAAEAKRKQEEEARRKKEAKAKRKQEEAKRRAAEAEKKRKAAEAAARKAKEELQRAEQAAQARRKQQRLAEQREAARLASQIDAWKVAIKTRIKRVWVQPPTISRRPCEVVVKQNRKGEVLSASIRDCVASQAWQESLRKAVLKASPLPKPPKVDLLDHTLVVTFYPESGG